MLPQPDLVRFEGPLNVRAIQPVHRQMLDRLETSQALTVDLPDGTDADISFIQLMESARLYAASKGKSLTLSRPVGAALRDVLRRSGFTDCLTPERAQFWFHQGEQQ